MGGGGGGGGRGRGISMALTIYKINIKYTVLSVAKYLLRIMFSSPVPGNFQSDFRFDSATVKVFCTNRNGRLEISENSLIR